MSKIATITKRTRAMFDDGTSGFINELWFSGASTDLPITGYTHGDMAYCFAGTDKGKLFVFDAENSEWVEQE